MEFARHRAIKAVYNFCRDEIKGYHDSTSGIEQDCADLPYRVIEFFASTTGPLNPNYFGFGSQSGLFSYIEQNPEKFIPVRILDKDGIVELEHKADSFDPTFTAMHLTRPLADFNDNAKNPERVVHLYARPNCYSHVLQGIRRRLVDKLAALLPKM
jgi:hypothetical protein